MFLFLLGKQSYSEVEYTGVLHINSDRGIDYVGIVFGYQSNKRFYILQWKHQNMNYGNDSYLVGTRGIQLKVSDTTYSFLAFFLFESRL